MQPDRDGRGCVGGAPGTLVSFSSGEAENPRLPQAAMAHQGADIGWLADTLARRHLIPLSHARVFAEAVRP